MESSPFAPRGGNHAENRPRRGGAAEIFTVGIVATTLFALASVALHTFAESSDGWRDLPAAGQEASVYLGGLAGFVAIAAVVAAGAYLDPDPDALGAAVLPVCVLLWELTSLYMIGFQMSIVWVSADAGLLIYPQQCLLWSFSLPALLYMVHYYGYISSTAHSDNRWVSAAKLASGTLCVWCMLASGLAAALQHPAGVVAFFVLGCLFFAAAAYFATGLLGTGNWSPDVVPGNQSAISFLQSLFRCGCLLFPVVFILRFGQTVDPMTGAMLTLLSDTVLKCCFAIAAVSRGTLSSKGISTEQALMRRASGHMLKTDSQQSTKDLCFAEMAHELRTPLNGIIGILGNLLHSHGHELSDHTKTSLNTVLTTSKRFSKLVGSVLDSCAMDVGKLSLYRGPVSVRAVLDDVVPLIEPLLNPKIKLAVKLPMLPAIDADHERIVQVLMNLLGNAAKFTTAGTITVAGAVDGNFVNISVTDTGKGIPAEKMDKMLVAFEQSADAASAKCGSTGLGLYMVKKLVEAHGGELVCKSVVGEGSTFTARIPKSDQEPPESATLSADKGTGLTNTSGSRTGPAALTSSLRRAALGKDKTVSYLGADGSDMDGRGMELLSVDDDPVNQVVIADILGSIGFTITKAMDAAEALEILAERSEQDDMGAFPDLILMDQMMPRTTGVECTRIIRERYPHLNIPIIMVSANDDEESVVQGLQNGCNDYITKPIKRMELMARIGLQLRVVEYFRREVEAQQHEQILSGILPDNIIERLKNGQTQIADALKEVTILFSDIVGFTELTASVGTIEIIKMLDVLFSKFDSMVDRHNVYKVETIGDAYMIVAGHNSATESDHAARMTRVAMDMIEIAAGLTTPAGEPLRIRVGLHSGPAYAGVVGHKCPRYCFFGDTVNTASRMESNGYPMTVHMSSSTHSLVTSQCSDITDFCDMGAYKVKGKGRMRTWLLKFGEHEKALELHTAKLQEVAEGCDQPQQPAKALSGGVTREIESKLDRLDQRMVRMLEIMESADSDSRSSFSDIVSGSLPSSFSGAARPSFATVTFASVPEDVPDDAGQSMDPKPQSQQRQWQSKQTSSPDTSAVLADLTSKMESLTGAVTEVQQEVSRQSMEMYQGQFSSVRTEQGTLPDSNVETNSAGSVPLEPEGWNANTDLSPSRSFSARLPQRRVSFKKCKGSNTLDRDQGQDQEEGQGATVAEAARKSLLAARKSLDGHRVRLLAMSGKSFSNPGVSPSPFDNRGPDSSTGRAAANKDASQSSRGVRRTLSNRRLEASDSDDSKLEALANRRKSTPLAVAVPGVDTETLSEKSAELMTVLTEAGLSHYASTLVLNNATVDKLKGMTADELATFGIFTTRAQQRVHGALAKVWDTM